MRALPFILVLMCACGRDPDTVTQYLPREDSPEPETTPALVEPCAVQPSCEEIVEKLIEQGRLKRRKWERLDAKEICSE
jgi:hypothetical protein